MPHRYFTRKSNDRTEMFFAEMPRRKESSSCMALNIGESSSSASFISRYENLPDHLKSCLDYCAIVSKRYPIAKDKLVWLLLAEGLIPEKTGEIMEDVTKKVIGDLVCLGMLEELYGFGELKVPGCYSKLCLIEVDEQDFVGKAANLPVRAVIEDDGKNIPPDFKNLQIHSLFLVLAGRRGFDSSQCLSQAYMKTICKLQYLLVLDLNGKIECLPEEVGDLVHLKYLGLVWSGLKEFPRTLGNLQNLQTLDISWCQRLKELPIQILNIEELRHLIMSNSNNDGEIIVPKGIGTLVKLHTLTGVYAGGGTASELSTLTQLRELGVNRVSEDHASELVVAIMKMENLVSLSLEAERSYFEDGLFPELESFSPPPLIQYLKLSGTLTEMPNWLAYMQELTVLSLAYSNLLENPTPILQFLPKLKHLYLCNDAYKAKCMGKEFCEAGGFSKLATLVIHSRFLVEWTEIVNGAFPSLRYLEFWNCMKLSFLPEGLQNISTLEELFLWNTHKDLGRRLQGEENYKIKHISKVRIGPF